MFDIERGAYKNVLKSPLYVFVIHNNIRLRNTPNIRTLLIADLLTILYHGIFVVRVHLVLLKYGDLDMCKTSSYVYVVQLIVANLVIRVPTFAASIPFVIAHVDTM